MISTTYIASIVALATLVLPMFGITVVDEGTLTKSLTEMAGAIAVIYTFYGRYKAGGISALGLRVK